jgi:hypothetical protein
MSAALIGRGGSLPAAMLGDAALTVTLSPIFSIVAFVLAVLPLIVVVLVMLLAEVTARDHTSGMKELLSTLPRLKRSYVLWKFGSALLLTLCLTGIPILRFLNEPRSELSLLSGSVLIAAGAVSLGLLTGSGKLFVACFLLLLYICLNAREVAIFDFIGISGSATPVVQGGFLLISLSLILAAIIRHRTEITH